MSEKQEALEPETLSPERVRHLAGKVVAYKIAAYDPDGSAAVSLVKRIVREAAMAERERCAKVALMECGCDNQEPADAVAIDTCMRARQRIATRIRSTGESA